MKVYLTVVRGARSATIPLRLPTTIGRSDTAKIRVRQGWVSRRHCELSLHDHRLVVRDLGSANGTYLNDQRIDGPRPVMSGDLLRVGQVTFRVDWVPTDADAVPAREDSPVTQTAVAVPAAPADESPAILRYDEAESGSFVAIDTHQPPVVPVAEFPGILGAKRVPPVDQGPILDLGRPADPEPVDDDDSALQRFLHRPDA